MQQVSQLHPQEGRIRVQMSRLLHNRRAAWWLALLSVTGLTQFAAIFVIAIGVSVRAVNVPNQPELSELSDEQVLLALASSILVALAVAIRTYRKGMDALLEPPQERIPRKRWGWYANAIGAMVALGAAYTSWWMWTLLLVGLIMAAKFVVSLPTWWTADVFLFLTIPVPLVLTVWAFVAWRRQALETLETAQPPELRLATSLIRHAEEFQERARALERAMEEAAAISKQVQRGIELEQQQLADVREQYRQQARLNALSAEEVSALGVLVAEEQRRGTRWGMWWNLAIAVVSLAAGLVLQALIDLDALGDQLRQWLPFG